MTAHLQNTRQPLHLHIDPFTYESEIRSSPDSSSSSSSVALSLDTTDTNPSTSYEESSICTVLCMFDFDSDDPDHLPFSKNEILAIVKQEESGWWAAMRSDTEIGWIPQAFVERISEDMADRLRKLKKEVRCYEYNAEILYTGPVDPPLSIPVPVEPSVPSPRSPRRRTERENATPQIEIVQAGLDSELSYELRVQRLPSPQDKASQLSLYAPYTSYHPSRPEPFLSPTEQNTHTRIRADTAPNNSRTHGHSNSGGVELKHRRPTEASRIIYHIRSSPVIHHPRPTQAWYLKPIYLDELEIDPEGHIRYATLRALVEKLTSEATPSDTEKVAEENLFRHIFLRTFRTFTTADVLFDMLVETYRMDHPKDLATAEFEEWKEYLKATQLRVLVVFTMWLEDHRLLEEEPHIASKLTDFLQLIQSPPLAAMARLLQKKIRHLTFASPAISPTTSPKKSRRHQIDSNNLLKLDPVVVAQHLTLIESKHYAKVTPQECLRHGSKDSEKPSNLVVFSSTLDKVVAWVKASVLGNEALGKRASTIEFWIKVAEKCKTINNFATMSAIITALSSMAITRLHLTWAHVSRKTTLDSLLRHNDPTGGFASYRNLLQNVEGPCVPFIIMFLTDLAHIQDAYTDEAEGRICFFQRQKSYETIGCMLRYQSRSYEIAEDKPTTDFIWRHLDENAARDNDWFWNRSLQVQHSELAHADIRKGLEAAGF